MLVPEILEQVSNKTILRVDARREGGISSRIKVRRGQRISFFATGLVSYDGGYHFTTPEGILANEFGIPLSQINEAGSPAYTIWPNEHAYLTDGGILGRIGSLIGWIGDYDPFKAFVAGTKREFDNEEGELWLAVNDAKGTYEDNVGEFRVEVTLTEISGSKFSVIVAQGISTKIRSDNNDVW